MIEPIDPDQGGIFNLTGRPPRTLATDHLGLIQANDGFSQGIVVGVANGSDRPVDACFGQATGVSNREILNASVRVWIKPSRSVRACRACSSASSTKAVPMDRSVRQPTMRLAKTSMTNAV